MHSPDDKYTARPGFEPGTSRSQAPVDTSWPILQINVVGCNPIGSVKNCNLAPRSLWGSLSDSFYQIRPQFLSLTFTHMQEPPLEH